MKADWKDPKKELPEQRIRVIVCDTLGYMETAYYGRQSSIDGDAKVCWRSDETNGGYEKELPDNAVALWDYFPNDPFPSKGPFEI